MTDLMVPSRRRFFGLLAAPAIIRTAGLLMPISTLALAAPITWTATIEIRHRWDAVSERWVPEAQFNSTNYLLGIHDPASLQGAGPGL